jgi:hypothetical protein
MFYLHFEMTGGKKFAFFFPRFDTAKHQIKKFSLPKANPRHMIIEYVLRWRHILFRMFLSFFGDYPYVCLSTVPSNVSTPKLGTQWTQSRTNEHFQRNSLKKKVVILACSFFLGQNSRDVIFSVAADTIFFSFLSILIYVDRLSHFCLLEELCLRCFIMTSSHIHAALATQLICESRSL